MLGLPDIFLMVQLKTDMDQMFSWCLTTCMHTIFTSRSGRGNRIGPVCVCVSVRLLFSTLTTEPICLLCMCVSSHHGKTTFGQKDCTWGGHGRYVNTQAYSSVMVPMPSGWSLKLPDRMSDLSITVFGISAIYLGKCYNGIEIRYKFSNFCLPLGPIVIHCKPCKVNSKIPQLEMLDDPWNTYHAQSMGKTESQQ